MRNALLFIITLLMLNACNIIDSKSVKGSGNISTQKRDVGKVSKVKLYGDFDVILIPGADNGVSVTADDNLMQYIITEQHGDELEIRPREHTRLKTEHTIKVIVYTNTLEGVEMAGSGKIATQGKFTGSDKLDINIAGSGDVDVEINTPEIKTSIAGSGDVHVSGETKKLDVNVMGSGNFKGEALMSEDADINIAGSGDATVFADGKLKASIAGSGKVFYKGKAEITSHIAGSGSVNPL